MSGQEIEGCLPSCVVDEFSEMTSTTPTSAAPARRWRRVARLLLVLMLLGAAAALAIHFQVPAHLRGLSTAAFNAQSHAFSHRGNPGAHCVPWT